ncbi:hypothetical protein GGX14DRAFT_472931 [Mycena pura]|uniref:Zn(2)-C6 fungal-type domain-containing protein n=1 Tax=Mycena pura TaxID=153505 RepID=A0AAD6V0R9_9AGAR|nr:hypothetical protein GGX14DRAFT_472931 [Mycena pura]
MSLNAAAEGVKNLKHARTRPPKPRAEPLRRGKACLNCRHLKIRCDGVRPVCGPCVRVPKDDECEYADVNSRTKELQATIKRLQARVEELENPSSGTVAGPSFSCDRRSPSLESNGVSDGSGFISTPDAESDHSLLGVQVIINFHEVHFPAM